MQGSPETTIKRAYRRLSVILHPDKETGDEKAFMTLTKGSLKTKSLYIDKFVSVD